MALKRVLLRNAAHTAWSLGLTAAFVFLDGSWNANHQKNLSLTWARQVADQAILLVTDARKIGEKFPIAWATERLNLGGDNRLYQVSEERLAADFTQTEAFKFDSGKGELDYTRAIDYGTAMGVRVWIPMGYPGFLRTHSPIASKALQVTLFAVIFSLIWLSMRRTAFGVIIMKRKIRLWIEKTKSTVLELGSNVRELVRAARDLVSAVSRSRDSLVPVQAAIKERYEELCQAEHAMRMAAKLATETEVAALNVVLEISRTAKPPERLVKMSEELHHLCKQVNTLSKECDSTVRRLQTEFEPWENQVGAAFQAYEEVFNTSEQMSEFIRSTTHSFQRQATQITSLREEFKRTRSGT